MISLPRNKTMFFYNVPNVPRVPLQICKTNKIKLATLVSVALSFFLLLRHENNIYLLQKPTTKTSKKHPCTHITTTKATFTFFALLCPDYQVRIYCTQITKQHKIIN